MKYLITNKLQKNRKYPPGHHSREGFVHLLGLSFNINVQSGLKLHREVVLPDDDSLEPALYQGLVEGFQVCGLLLDEILQFIDAGNLCVPGSNVNRAFFSLLPEFENFICNLIIGLFVIGFFEKLFLEFLQSFVDTISGILLSISDYLCNVLLELRLVGGLITKERVDSLNYHIPQYRLIDGSCVAFLPGRLQPTDAAPDDGFAATIVPVNSAEHFATFAANDNLSKAVVATIGALFAIGTGFDHSPSYQLFLYPQENVLRNNCFVVAFYIVLWNNAIVLHSGLIQEVCGISFLKQGIADVFLVSEDFVDGAGPPFCFASAGEDAVCFQTLCNPVHRVALQVFTVDTFYHLCLFRIDDEISICILGVAEEVIVIYLYLAILVAKLESQLYILAEGL